MKTFKLFFIAFLIFFISKIGTAQTTEHKTYDYATIFSDALKPSFLYLSINGEKYEEVKLNKPREYHDFNEVLKIVKKYEVEGYEVLTSNITANPYYLYFLLRKEHKE